MSERVLPARQPPAAEWHAVIDPSVEKQYWTDPPKHVAEVPIDVTPSHLRDERRD